MQSQVDASLIAGEALLAYRRVKINSAREVVYADVTEVAQYITLADTPVGDLAGLRSINTGGSAETITEAACTTIGAIVYGRNNGMVSLSNADSAIPVGYSKRIAAIGETLEYQIANI